MEVYKINLKINFLFQNKFCIFVMLKAIKPIQKFRIMSMVIKIKSEQGCGKTTTANKTVMLKHGGKRTGAGRKKSAPNTVLSVTIKKALKDSLIAKYGSRQLTTLTKTFLKNLSGNEKFVQTFAMYLYQFEKTKK